MKTLVVIQPGYLPWLGFFDQLHQSDAFVYYDDVQFDKHGWRNRNRIKTPAGPLWLTVPVLHKGQGKPLIHEVEIDNKTAWARKHLGSIRQYYAKAPHLDRYLPELTELLGRPWEKLCELDLAVVELLCGWLGLRREIHRSSRLGIEGDQNGRLLNLCRHFGADRYISGDAAKEYLDVPLFARSGIEVKWHDYRHPTYSQLHGDFLPQLSALDLVLNEGEKSLAILTGKAP